MKAVAVVCMGLIVLLSVVGVAEGIKCYVCQGVPSNALCNRTSDIRDCGNNENGKRYDTCETDISYQEGNGLVITKQCAFGPCDLDSGASQFLDPTNNKCDKSKSSWKCVECCETHECNKSGGQRLYACADVSGILAFVFGLIATLRLLK